MIDSTWISFRDLPPSSGGFSKLYVDYISDFARVQHYFETDFHSMPGIPKQIEQLRSHDQHRTRLVEVLREQNERYGVRSKTMEHIEQLAETNAFAVVTGQQVGILGGPMYTIYKTLTAVKLAERLREAFPDYKFVPVFWLEGEDHDFEEVNKVVLLNQENIPTKIEYLINGKPLEKNLGAVGEIQFDGYLQAFFEEIRKCLPNSEFKSGLLELFERFYTTGATFGTSFARFLSTIFEDEGLVFISPNDRRLKQLLSPIFQKEVQEYPRVSQLIIQRSAELEERYHAQIKTKALNLFMFHKGGRYFIEPREHDFSLKGTRHFLTKEELLGIAVETPELLSPNVALRPICQDALLPTVAYVAGPSEIAYFAQLKPVYQYFNLRMPVIYPRASVTLHEGRSQKVLEKFEVDVSEIFAHQDRIRRKVVEMVSEVKIDEMFADASKRTSELLNEMKFGLNYIDPTLLGPLESAREKFETQLTILKEKVQQAQERKHETALRQLNKATNNLMPNGNFQERELNVAHFLNKHGMGFIQRLKDQVRIDEFKHQILHI
ncbi:MAG TPA: bacillithiol biosynthesis cysteine-adding enzyme BshC [Bacteroidota bacterium]|jgi:bacillithiol biosynthesis cysteine-adding enzyme BshC|nr:bacillithiol biosynthesis cysteine-adding enzyme BshC [Bacteroidota bacterium]